MTRIRNHPIAALSVLVLGLFIRTRHIKIVTEKQEEREAAVA